MKSGKDKRDVGFVVIKVKKKKKDRNGKGFSYFNSEKMMNCALFHRNVYLLKSTY